MLRRITVGIVILIIAIFVAAHFAGKGFVAGKIERAVARKLPSVLGRAKSYRVYADGTLTGMLSGRLNALHIKARDVRLPCGVVANNLNIDAEGLAFNTKQSTISSVRKCRFTALLSQRKLDEYVAKSFPNLPKPQIVLANGKLLLHAEPLVLDRRIPVYAEGNLAIENGTKLDIDLKMLHASGIKMPGAARKKLERKLNPLLDTSHWAFPAKLISVAIRPGLMIITGAADLARRN